MNEVEMDQINVLENMLKCDNKSKPRPKKSKAKKIFFGKVHALYEGRELTHNVFINRIFPIKATQGRRRPNMLPSRPSDLARVVKVFHRTRLKIFTSKQMLQRLPIALVQVKAGILNETR